MPPISESTFFDSPVFRFVKQETDRINQPSVVGLAHFKEALCVVAHGTDVGSLHADHDVAADAAFPHRHFALFEDLLHLNVVQELAVALFMGLFDRANHAELRGDFGKAFFLGFLGEAVVHIGPLVVFTFGGGLQVGGRIADAAEQVEPQAGVFLFIVGLRFAGKGFGQVLGRLGAFELSTGGGGLVLNGLEHIGTLVAQQADIIFEQRVAFVDGAANLATILHEIYS